VSEESSTVIRPFDRSPSTLEGLAGERVKKRSAGKDRTLNPNTLTPEASVLLAFVVRYGTL
jgi:hypothetical protein